MKKLAVAALVTGLAALAVLACAGGADKKQPVTLMIGGAPAEL